MIKQWLIQMAISFVMRQIAKWENKIDWAKVKADMAERVAALVPGSFFDSEAIAICNAVIDACAAAMGSSEALEQIVKFAVSEKFQEAWEALRKLILESWVPVSGPEQRVFAMVQNTESFAA